MLPETAVSFSCADPSIQRLFDAACEACKENLKYFGPDQVLVEGGGYEKIWLETQPMGGEMYAKYDLPAALNNQLLFIRHQRADGRLPGSIQGFGDGRVEAQFDKFQGFCFPWPAMNMYYWIGQDRDYLIRLYDCLKAFDAYLWRVRDADGDGILESWCVYDTGEDNALRYGDAPVYWTEDVPPSGYAAVPMASMDVTAFSYAARDTLAEISGVMRNGQEKAWRAAADSVAASLKARLWDARRGACFDRDSAGKPMPVLCHNNLRCMYWGAFSREMADRFVRDHLLNPSEFWTKLPLPSVAANDPLFRNAPENNWSGQCEGLTYQRAILALERYGYYRLVTCLGKKLMRAVIDGGYIFSQQFDPFTGAPSLISAITKKPLLPGSCDPCQDSYCPTALSVLEYMAHIWGITMVRGSMWFSLGEGLAYTWEQKWGGDRFRISSDGQEARIFINGDETARSSCGVRLIVSPDGRILGKAAI
ncbi:MAG: hypothetical protein IKQ41_13625 [Clostridia bacterium]|nr:hypothetical protein [Clostridia bacterium]